MAVMAGAAEELGWFRQLGSKALSLAKKGSYRDVEERPSPREWQSFDLADVMEQGLAQELTTCFVTPPPKNLPPKNLIVRRSKDRSRYVLMDEDSQELLLARRSADRHRIDIYVPTGGDPPVALGPAFTLSAQDSEHSDSGVNSSDEGKKVVPVDWILSTDRCVQCQYLSQARLGCCAQKPCRQEVAKITQSKIEIGPAAIMCMEVDIPQIREDGTPEVLCTRKRGIDDTDCKLRLVSRRPFWNRRIKSLTLSFHGRCTNPSTQNIQLDLKDSGKHATSDELPEFLFGSVAEHEFVLDYKYPLGMAQAFAMALSTEAWEP